jgi:hypothetical protein
MRLDVPYCVSAALMAVGLILVIAAARRGADFIPKSSL